MCNLCEKTMQLIFSPSSESSFNLAAEEFLFLTKKGSYVFLYVNKPSVIIGSNQVVENEVNIRFCTENNIRVIRRLSGGGAVYHDEGNLNYCFIHEKTATPLSTGFLIPVVEVLKSLNIPVEIGKRKDLWIDGYKISGTASHISKNRELHHGTLLYDTDLEKLQHALTPEKQDLVRKGTRSVPSPVKNIRTFIEQKNEVAPGKSAFFDMFTQRMLNSLGIDALLTSFPDEEVEKVREIQTRKYVDLF